MKDFNYYSEIKTERPDRYTQWRVWTDEINNTPMTAKERSDALDDLRSRLDEWMKEAMKPHNTELKSKTDEFWHHCREEFGYHKLFSEKGVAALESKAWSDGHSGGFQEVYNVLSDLSDLAITLSQNTLTHTMK